MSFADKRSMLVARLGAALICSAAWCLAQDEVAVLDAFSVKADRFEDFGFRADDAFPDGISRRRSR
jgi:hypothetical protein